MIVWALIVVAVAILSYLGDVGVNTLIFNKRVPLPGFTCNPSLASVLLMLCGLGMMGRIKYMMKKGGKEKLRERVQELEKKLEEKTVKGK
ncbi:MAG: hypothetical protein V2A65_04950 [Candidatus Omnitrophota bacterium]